MPGAALFGDRRYAEDQRGGEREYDRDYGSLKARVMQAAAEIPPAATEMPELSGFAPDVRFAR
ncbi:MAG TPA: hypothetical protein VMC03_23715 [Streptosporangiaceae bacterium]|nr:hypothetical protein [Streptosporangiaceae bacterium]